MDQTLRSCASVRLDEFQLGMFVAFVFVCVCDLTVVVKAAYSVSLLNVLRREAK